MLDSRIYRAAFVPVLVAMLVAAFALGERPRPIGTTLAPDAFDGRRAFATLMELSRTFPRTRPGSAGDEALATRIGAELRRAGFRVRTSTTTADTVDGDEPVKTVIGEREGLSNRRLVIATQRDAAGEDEVARMSGTAALVELARLYSGRPIRRTLVLVSTSGGTGGMAGVRDLPQQLGGPVDAVIAVGDLAGRRLRRPFVLPWAESGGMAPLRLRRTVEGAVRLETDLDPGSPRALVQLARLAVPVTLTPQGPLGADGLSAVTVQASGERGPSPGGGVSQNRLQAFGRSVLRSISALDNGPDVPAGPREYLIVKRRVLPRWAVAVIGALLLLPALLASIDGLARVRRRRRPVAIWLRWLVAAAAPFALTALFARLIGLMGVLPSLRGAVDPRALPVEVAGIVAVGLALVLGLLARAPLARTLGAPVRPQPEDAPGVAAAIAVTLSVLGVLVWAFNPYTLLLLLPAIHLWLLAAVPEVRLARPALVLMVLLGLLPFGLVGVHYAGEFGLDGLEVAWAAVLLLAGGTTGPLGVLTFSAVLGCGLAAAVAAVRKPRDEPLAERAPQPPRRTLGPAGPGSLGGTESALRR